MSGALVDGVAAHVLDRLLASTEVRCWLAGMPPWVRAEVDATGRALARAAAAYLARPAVDGSTEAPGEVDGAGSDLIDTAEAAAVLGVTPRRVRQLAAGGIGTKRAGRWMLHRGLVDVLREERRQHGLLHR